VKTPRAWTQASTRQRMRASSARRAQAVAETWREVGEVGDAASMAQQLAPTHEVASRIFCDSRHNPRMWRGFSLRSADLQTLDAQDVTGLSLGQPKDPASVLGHHNLTRCPR